MTKNTNILNEINKINTKITALEQLISGIVKNAKTFSHFFPNQNFGSNEKKLIENEIKQLQEKMQTLSLTMEKDPMLDIDIVSQNIKEAWGRTKIKTTLYNLAENEDDFEHAQDIFKRAGIIVDKNEIQIIEYYLNTNSRSELYMVRAFLAPGFAYATFDTGRVGWNTDVLTNNKFLKQVAAEVDMD